MDVNKKQFIDKYKESRPAVSSFGECISRAYLTGLASFALGASSVHLAQSLLKKKLPYAYKVQLMISLSVGVGVAYKVGTDKFRLCQSAFLAEEGRATYFTQTKVEDSEE